MFSRNGLFSGSLLREYVRLSKEVGLGAEESLSSEEDSLDDIEERLSLLPGLGLRNKILFGLEELTSSCDPYVLSSSPSRLLLSPLPKLMESELSSCRVLLLLISFLNWFPRRRLLFRGCPGTTSVPAPWVVLVLAGCWSTLLISADATPNAEVTSLIALPFCLISGAEVTPPTVEEPAAPPLVSETAEVPETCQYENYYYNNFIIIIIK